MKTSFILTAFCIVSLSIFLVWSKLGDFNHNISISVKEDEQNYTFTASYDPSNTVRVERYINANISPDKMGSSENDYVDATTTLDDKTTFHIKEAPGKLKIEFDKRINSTNSYYRIKKMCDGIKGLVAGK